MRWLISLGIVGCLALAGFVFVRANGEAKKSREDELVYLRTVLPADLLEYAHVDVSSLESVAVMGEGPAKFLGLRIHPGQKKLHRGVRSELSVDVPFRPGDTVRYSWRFMLPEGFASDAPKNRWWLIGQWHDQPNLNRGEQWDMFPSSSPPVLLSVGELDGRLMIGLGYGPTNAGHEQQKIGPVPVDRGKWHSVTMAVRWSRGADGTADVFLNDLSTPVMTARGPNMNNEYQHFWKVGMYRHPEIATDNWIYIDDLNAANVAGP